MPRAKRIIIPDLPHHIVQRASHGEFIIRDDRDRAVLIRILLKWQADTDVLIAAFVIMGNHFHLVATASSQAAMSRFMGSACAEYSRYFNSQSGDRGPNWQDRYYAAPMDAEHTVNAIRYIERNPVAANMVLRPWDWQWSSAAYHAGIGSKPQLLNADFRPLETTATAWRHGLNMPTCQDFRRRLRDATRMRRALGQEEWAKRIDEQLGRSPKGRGRPPKNSKESPIVDHFTPLLLPVHP